TLRFSFRLREEIRAILIAAAFAGNPVATCLAEFAEFLDMTIFHFDEQCRPLLRNYALQAGEHLQLIPFGVDLDEGNRLRRENIVSPDDLNWPISRSEPSTAKIMLDRRWPGAAGLVGKS